jgi:hypothetical protein
MSDTPRTDSEAGWYDGSGCWTPSVDGEVGSDFARTLERELAAAKADAAELMALLPGSYYMDPPDGGDVSVVEQFRRMAEDAERWRFVRRKVCFSGIGDGTAHMDIINLPISKKFPDLGEHEACADAAIDAALAKEKDNV